MTKPAIAWAERFAAWLFLFALATVLWLACSSCSSFWPTLGRYGAVAGGAAGGALVGSAGGPAGAAIGGAAGAVAVGGVADAMALEDERAKPDVVVKDGGNYNAASSAFPWSWVIAGAVIYFMWRNRAHLTFTNGVGGFARGVWHSVIGGGRKA